LFKCDPKLLKDLFEPDRLRMHVIDLALTYLNVEDLTAVAPTLFHAPIHGALPGQSARFDQMRQRTRTRTNAPALIGECAPASTAIAAN
jgi:hypothetical protein